MIGALLWKRERIRVPCTVEIEHSCEYLEAHVELQGYTVEPGDEVLVHAPPQSVPFGQRQTFSREATVTRARWWTRLWTRIRSQLETLELFEVSFSPRRYL
nr:hypothetical protein [Oceanococcus sp. HetDA_MAG_MS8]